MQAFRRILVPTDFSPDSDRAVTLAECLARQNDAPMVLVHVIEAPGLARELQISAPVLSNEKVLLDEAGNELRRLAERVLPKSVEVKFDVAIGRPAEEIVRLAAEEGADLIVMGTVGRSAARQLLAGSVAERVVRTAPCAVLTVKRGDDSGQ